MQLKALFRVFGLAILILSPLVIYLSISISIFHVQPTEKAPWVSWYDDPAHEVYISWETKTNRTGYIQYSTSPTGPWTQVDATESLQIQHITISGLIPDQTYYYQVFSSEAIHGTGTFHTAPITDQSNIHWGMISDTHGGIRQNGFDNMISVMKNQNYSFLTISGDIGNEGRIKANYDTFFKSAAPLLKNTALIPILGNHDDDDSNPNSWFWKYFVNNENRKQFYYSFNYSMVHFTICHLTYANMEEFTEEQMEWIERDLQNNQDKPFRVILFHCPIKGNAFFGTNTNLVTHLLPLLEKYNVQLCVTGHEHSYTRNQIGNVTQLVVGTSAYLTDPGLRYLNTTQTMITSPCFVDATANSTHLDLKTYGLNGEVVDNFLITA